MRPLIEAILESGDEKLVYFDGKYQIMNDKSSEIRKGQELELSKLNAYLAQQDIDLGTIQDARQFHGGFSNLTYEIISGDKSYVLRRPPIGADIKSAHDMGREYEILTKVKKNYPHVPQVLHYCGDTQVIGSEFYIMEKVNGVIYKNAPGQPPYIDQDKSIRIAHELIDNLVALHALDLQETGLDNMGRPDGYMERQITGWIKRYRKAQTSDVSAMDALIEWLPEHMPAEQITGFIHNDYKLDNIMWDPKDTERITAVLDWEMSTVGDVLMDLGTAMFYWCEPQDHITIQQFNPYRAMSHNLTREEAISRYADQSGRDIDDFLFYYAFGGFKLCVIIQQIYQRYVAGYNKNKAMANFHLLVAGFSENAQKAIQLGRISHLS